MKWRFWRRRYRRPTTYDISRMARRDREKLTRAEWDELDAHIRKVAEAWKDRGEL